MTVTAEDLVIDAVLNAVAVASTAYQEERGRFRHVTTIAVQHGAPVNQVAAAAGLSCEQLATLINEGEL